MSTEGCPFLPNAPNRFLYGKLPGLECQFVIALLHKFTWDDIPLGNGVLNDAKSHLHRGEEIQLREVFLDPLCNQPKTDDVGPGLFEKRPSDVIGNVLICHGRNFSSSIAIPAIFTSMVATGIALLPVAVATVRRPTNPPPGSVTAASPAYSPAYAVPRAASFSNSARAAGNPPLALVWRLWHRPSQSVPPLGSAGPQHWARSAPRPKRTNVR